MEAGAQVLLLGGDSDIARAAARSLARSRPVATVVVAARSPEVAADRMRSVLEPSSPTTTVVAERWDATAVDGHEAAAARWWAAHGPFDVVLCAVGVLGHHAGATMSPVDLSAMFATNAAGPAAMLAALTPHLVDAGAGVVVALSSVAAARARRSNFVYGASKAALDTYAQGLGDALAPHGVRVVVVRPGFVRSKMTVGLDPAPFSTTPEVVGDAVARAVAGGRSHTVWVPRILGPVLGLLRTAPRPLWRRIAGDR